MLTEGARVRLAHLVSRPELNGAEGVVVGKLTAAGRFVVRLQDRRELLLKPTCLTVIHPPPERTTAAPRLSSAPSPSRFTHADHYNTTLCAPNVWEVPVPADVLADAKAIFDDSSLKQAFHRLRVGDAAHMRHPARARGLSFFVLRSSADGGMGGMSSDITWISVDDQHTYDAFDGLFRRIQLERTFGSVVQHSGRLRMFSAVFVVRSRCAAPHFHVDYADEVGAQGLTLMTPLGSFRNTSSFNLVYGTAPHGSPKPVGAPVRYVYREGTGIAFGAKFRHSTEPGIAHEEDGVHVYLCFTFGTDQMEHWPSIAKTIGGNQSRVIVRPDGALCLTRLGEELNYCWTFL